VAAEPPLAPRTDWVYDLRGLDLVAWGAAAPSEFATLFGAADTALLLVGDPAPAALAELQALLAAGGYAFQPTRVSDIGALKYPAAPTSSTAPETAP
jgi:hypothetical protein